jgi:hypothetical protein
MRSSENQEKIAYPTLPDVSTNARNGVDSPAGAGYLKTKNKGEEVVSRAGLEPATR